jgi:ABC-type branched-subunit amino acid transport system ATPase component
MAEEGMTGTGRAESRVDVSGTAVVASGNGLCDQRVQELNETQERLLPLGRRIVGLSVPEADDGGADLRTGESISSTSFWATGAAGATCGLMGYGWMALSPQMGLSLGRSATAFALLTALYIALSAVLSFPLAALARTQWYPRAILLCALASTVALAGMAWMTILQVGFLLAVVGSIAIAGAGAFHLPYLLVSSGNRSRIRLVGGYLGCAAGGIGLAALATAIMEGALALTWRSTWLFLALMSLVTVLLTTVLSRPPVAPPEVRVIRSTFGPDQRTPEVDTIRIAPGEALSRLMAVPTFRALLAAAVSFGMVTFVLGLEMGNFLERRWRLSFETRQLFLAMMAASAVIGILLCLYSVPRRLRDGPRRLLDFGGKAAVGAVLLGVAPFLPWLWATTLGYALIALLLGLTAPILASSALLVVTSAVRGYAASMMTLSFVGLGTLAGLVLVNPIATRYGLDIGLAFLALPALQLGIGLRRQASRTIEDDYDRTIAQIVEQEFVTASLGRGRRLPLLVCQNVHFSYGQLQVLHGINIEVEEGEMVALLGTNGAGKSTLLRVISGLGVPETGTVRLGGKDITHFSPEFRLSMGITQIPGGRAVFGELTVVDNLRALGYSLGRRRAQLEARMDRCFELFPQLAARRHQVAATLSGGEQQMLGLAKAFLLKPRLLLIDELSLGLAPRVVSQLLELVRVINADGSAVVLVEQSVNVAFLLTEHVYFMEKGRIKFDGRTEDLRDRHDLLRSVFFDAATDGT